MGRGVSICDHHFFLPPPLAHALTLWKMLAPLLDHPKNSCPHKQMAPPSIWSNSWPDLTFSFRVYHCPARMRCKFHTCLHMSKSKHYWSNVSAVQLNAWRSTVQVRGGGWQLQAYLHCSAHLQIFQTGKIWNRPDSSWTINPVHRKTSGVSNVSEGSKWE